MSTVAWLVVKHLKFSRPWCEVQHTKWQKDWTLKTSSDKLAESNNYAYVFHESGFTSCITVKYWLEQDIQSLSECKSLHVCFSGEEGNLVECFSLFVDKTILLSCLIMVIRTVYWVTQTLWYVPLLPVLTRFRCTYYWKRLHSSVKWYQVYSSLGGKICVKAWQGSNDWWQILQELIPFLSCFLVSCSHLVQIYKFEVDYA